MSNEQNEQALVRLDGGEIYDSDVRKDNLPNFYWRMKSGEIVAITKMEDSHLRNTALMLIGMGYQTFNAPDRLKILWLSALRLEWERRMESRAR